MNSHIKNFFWGTIRRKLRFTFIISSVIIVLATSIILYFNGRNALRSEAVAGLEALRATRSEQIQLWVSDRRRDSFVLSRAPTVLLSTRSFVNNLDVSDNLGRTRAERMQALSEQYVGKPELFQADQGSIYTTTHKRFHEYYRANQAANGYADILLVSLDGVVVYSAQKNPDFQTNLRSETYENSQVQIVFLEAVAATEPDFVTISDFAYYEPARQIVQFVAVPVVENNMQLGILITVVPADRLDQVLRLRQSLGETGESYLVGQDYLMRNNSRFTDELGVEFTILNPAVSVDTAASESAFEGQSDTQIILDYRGQEVLSTWEPLMIKAATAFDVDGVMWVLIVEKGISEVDEPVNSLLLTILSIGALLILVVTWFTYILANQISNPIVELTKAAERITAGQLDQRVDIRSDDEVGILADSFNEMSAKLQATIDDLRQAKEDAQESSRLKSQFLATMSHELRTPMNAILGFTGIMLEGMDAEVPEKSRFLLQRVEANGMRLLELINDVLDIARIEAGRMVLAPSNLDIHALVGEWGHQMAGLAEEKNLKFSVTIDPDLPKIIWADRDALTKIASNLLANAFKFTKSGEVALSLLQAHNEIIIQVRDTGIGIPVEAQQYIFDEFRQADGSSTREYGGTGLGLTIVRRLVDSMNGEISLVSKVNDGSQFTVKIPLMVRGEVEVING